MRARLTSARGQTATELLGVLLIVATILALLAATGFGDDVRVAGVRQACLLVNDAKDCPVPDAPHLRTRPERLDTDHDHVPDVTEIQYGTNPRSADSDGDGVSDARELRAKHAASR